MAQKPGEFELIARWLSFFETEGKGVLIGAGGDDAAATRLSPGKVLVSTVDALVEDVHFRRDRCPAGAVGHKALAVNLSDVAAMGARPRWALVALTLPPGIDPRWLDRAAGGMAELARRSGTTLVGGNVSRGPRLSLTVTVLAEADPRRLLRRDRARPGDHLFVSGTLGDSALGLARLLARGRAPRVLGALEARHCRPEPRLALGEAVAAAGAAHACIDLSDGLAADLGHVLSASGVGAQVRLSDLPLSSAYRAAAGPEAWEAAVAGGEDYELLFTVPPGKLAAFRRAAARSKTPVTAIGRTLAQPGLVLLRPDGRAMRPARAGWTHL